MGTNSEQFIRIPGTLRGDRALEDFSRDVRIALEALRDRGAGFALEPSFASPYCPLTPHYLRPDGADWLVQWRPGYVYQLYASSAGPVQEYEIYIGATALSNATAPDLDISLGDYIYLHFETADDGEIKELGAPAGRYAEIVAVGAAQDSTYHVLPDGAGSAGTDGSYYILLGQVNTTSGGLATISRNGWRGNFFWHAGWNALENVGSGEKIYRDYDVATDRKRLRSLIERASSHQINLSQVGDDEIRIEGNNKTASLTFQDCSGTELYTLSWDDGLITNAADGTIEIPPCYNDKAALYFSAVESNDSYTFTSAQKSAISTFFDTMESACLLEKVKHISFMGTNSAVALRNAVCPGIVYCTWNTAPTTFASGAMDTDGVDGEMNQTAAELGLSTTSQGVFMTVTGVPRQDQWWLNAYSTSTKNTQLKQDTGELASRLSYSTVTKGRNETQNGLFIGVREGNNCVQVSQTAYGGTVSQTTITDTRTQTAGLSTNDIAYILGSGTYNVESQISTLGLTTGMNQTEAEYFATALFTVAVDTGHTALEST